MQVLAGRTTVKRCWDHDGHPLAMTTADAVAPSGIPQWIWRETLGNGYFAVKSHCIVRLASSGALWISG